MNKALATIGIWAATTAICCVALVYNCPGVCWIVLLSAIATEQVWEKRSNTDED